MWRKAVYGVALALVLAAACACTPQDDSDWPATVAWLQTTIDAQQRQMETLRAAAYQPTLAPVPSVTRPAFLQATLPVPSPLPLMTIQRPPTATPSPGPTPTPTNTPTATPIPDAAVGNLPANLRAGPNIRFDIVAELPADTPLTVLGKSVDGEWLMVRLQNGVEGWMYYLPLRLYIELDTIPVVE